MLHNILCLYRVYTYYVYTPIYFLSAFVRTDNRVAHVYVSRTVWFSAWKWNAKNWPARKSKYKGIT